jgi:hypothetical protein
MQLHPIARIEGLIVDPIPTPEEKNPPDRNVDDVVKPGEFYYHLNVITMLI